MKKVVGVINKSERQVELVEIDDTSTLTLDKESST